MAKEDKEAAYFKCDSCGEIWPEQEMVKTTKNVVIPGAKKGKEIEKVPSIICKKCSEDIKIRKRHF